MGTDRAGREVSHRTDQLNRLRTVVRRGKAAGDMNIGVAGTGSYLPDTVLSSVELGERLGTGEQWILDKTGIKERRVAAPEEATSDLATHAARRALKAADMEASDIDLLVLATANPDQPIPATACFVQANIGASRAVAFDVSAACTGFIFAVAVAHDMLQANPDRHTALVIGADIYSRSVDYTDKKTCVLLGDGAGAVVLRKTNSIPGILSTNIQSDGKLTELAHIPAGGTRKPASVATLDAREHYLHMRGRDVRETVAGLLPGLISQLSRSAGIEFSDVDLIVPHQANGVMLSEWAQSLGVTPHVVHQTVSWSGNTGAASVPIALDDAVRRGSLSQNDVLLLISFGAGVTWGGVALNWCQRRPVNVL